MGFSLQNWLLFAVLLGIGLIAAGVLVDWLICRRGHHRSDTEPRR